MSTPADEMFTWFAKEEHQVKVVQSLSVVSGKDKRKLRSKKYQEMNGIWGKAALMIFNENQEYQRFFLYTVWSEDKLRVQVTGQFHYFFFSIQNSTLNEVFYAKFRVVLTSFAEES